MEKSIVSGRVPRSATLSWEGTLVGLLLLAVIALGCGSQPIPLTAQAGTTFVLMVPKHVVPGFGRGWTGSPELYDPDDGPALYGWAGSAGGAAEPDLDLEDLQRGELFINAVKEDALGVADPSDPDSVFVFPVAYITRVAAAKTSAAALARTREKQDPNYQSSTVEAEKNWEGQVMAFVDIPTNTPEGDYQIYTQRRRRKFFSPEQWEDIGPMEDGWNNTEPVRLHVIAADEPSGPGNFSEFQGANNSQWQHNEARLKTMVPYPELRILVATAVPTLFRPAAAEIELEYPAGTVGIAGVALGKNDPSAAIVRWEIVPGVSSPGCWDPWTLRIHLVDPDQLTGHLRVAFHHIDPTTCPHWVPLSNFDIVSWSFYDEAGNPETDPGRAPTIGTEIY
jgi:hypothetical protein